MDLKIMRWEEWEKQKCAPKSFWKKMGEQGFLCMDMPEEYGGSGFDFTFNAMVLEETRRAQIDHYLPKMVTGELIGCIGMTEPSVGSDLKALKTVAEDKGDHYLVNGSKTFITNGYVADFVCCAVRTQKGTANEGISLLLIDKTLDGYSTGEPFDKIGIKYQDTCELFFEDVKVPKSKLLGEEGMGFKYMMSDLPRERVGIAVESLGSATGVLERTIQYVQERKAFGKSVADFQNTQFKLADCAAEIQVYQAFVDTCVALQAEHKLTTEQASIAKLKATEMHGKIVDECLQLFGGYGFIWEYEVARAYAGARVSRIYGGTSEIMKLIIGRGLFKEYFQKQRKKDL